MCLCVSVCICMHSNTQELELSERADETENEGHAGPGGLTGVLYSTRGPGR